MKTTERLHSVVEHLKVDLNQRLVDSHLLPVEVWGCYRVDDNRGQFECIGTVSLWNSAIDEDVRIGDVIVEIRLPKGSEQELDAYQDCLIESLESGGTFGDAFIETSVVAEEKWPSGPQVHAAVMVQLAVRINRLW